MKIFDLSFGCTGVSSVWKHSFENNDFQYELFDWEEVNTSEKRNCLTKKIEKSCQIEKTLVMYGSHGMDKDFEDYFGAMTGSMFLLPVGTGALLLNHCNVSSENVAEFNRYIIYGGEVNIQNAVKYLKKYICQECEDEPDDILETPFDGIYDSDNTQIVYKNLKEYFDASGKIYGSYIGIISHRSSWMNDSLQTEKSIIKALNRNGIGTIPVFSSGEKSEFVHSCDFQELLEYYFSIDDKLQIDGLINFQIHIMKGEQGLSIAENSVRYFSDMDIPVFHPISSYMVTPEKWKEENHPLAMEMQTAYQNPEMAGMVEPILVALRDGKTGEVIPMEECIDFLTKRVKTWNGLKRKPNQEKKLAIMLHNSVCAGVEATIGKAFGMDAFESIVQVLRRLQAEGYQVENIPENGAKLKSLILEKKAFSDFRWTSVEDICESGGCLYRMPLVEYREYLDELTDEMQDYMVESWGQAPGEGMVLGTDLIITGVRFGNILVMVQPKRGCYGAKCTGEVCRILHDPLCPPTHQYLATYRYISRIFHADAVIHFGTDGSLEYLPGKSSGPDKTSWPYVILDNLPNIYPYHPGVGSEGMISKRKANAVLLSYYPVSSYGTDSRNSDILRKIDAYMDAYSFGNGQEDSLCEELKNILSEDKLYQRLMNTSDTFEEGLLTIRSAILKSAQGAKLMVPHVFGEIPDKEECVNYISEVMMADGILAAEQEESTDYYRVRIREFVENCLNKACPENVIEESIMEIYHNLQMVNEEMEAFVHVLNGRYVLPGECGMPDENGRKVIPTGRNFFMMNMDKVPSEAAYARGKILAEQLLEAYIHDEGKYPKKIAMNMISIDIARTHGEQLSQFLYLMGITPVWDKYGRVVGLDVIPVSELKRPRIDITLRISGVMRDTWPDAVTLMDDAVVLVSQLEESDVDNYIRANIHEMEKECADLGERSKTIRIFGDPPGTFGAGVDLALRASAWKDDKDLARYFIQSSSYAYGKGLNGRTSVREFIENVKKVELTCDTSSSRRMDTLSCGFGLHVQGGFKLVAEAVGGKKVRQYQSSNEVQTEIKTQTLEESVQEDIENTLLNIFWREKTKERSYDGASDMMHRIQSVFDAACTSECVKDEILDKITEDYINDNEMREWLLKNNRFAAEEIARRLLELYNRGKWNPDENVLENLQNHYLMIEGDMEDGISGNGEIQGGSVEIIRDDEVEIWKKNLAEIDKYLKNI